MQYNETEHGTSVPGKTERKSGVRGLLFRSLGFHQDVRKVVEKVFGGGILNVMGLLRR
jgi:hypothetical protein